MAKKKTASTKPAKPQRPARLGFKRYCRDCEYMTSYHTKFKGTCPEVFEITGRKQACVEFTLALNPKRYRRDPDVARVVALAKKYGHLEELLVEASGLSQDGIFAALRRGKERHNLVTDAADLLEKHGAEGNNLVPLYERIQRLRDRAIAILSEAKAAHNDLGTIFDRGKSVLMRKFSELRNVKPAAVRDVLIDEILDELDIRQTQATSVIEVCEIVVRNAQSAHSAVLEIQATFNTNPAPFRRLPGVSRGGRGKGSGKWIRRKGDLTR